MLNVLERWSQNTLPVPHQRLNRGVDFSHGSQGVTGEKEKKRKWTSSELQCVVLVFYFRAVRSQGVLTVHNFSIIRRVWFQMYAWICCSWQLPTQRQV